ncbi:hypothetical protein TrLO_g7282 [Triparma laevis f. longispina]|uniref:Uncharacterized protein n=1 Tax=Triparma laevis f. longispina TaxID=1714387 RepID=A0A9W6ZY29_9STRA|nr:hypothetical protein TrLO_g7282 [Triparma laevis f. longispina]
MADQPIRNPTPLLLLILFTIFTLFYGSNDPISREQFQKTLSTSGWVADEIKQLTSNMYPPSGTFGPYDGPQKPYDGDEGKHFLIINFVKNREDPGYDYDYFAVVRYRSLRDFAENIDAMGEFFGESGMKALKMSGIEYTHLVKVEMP